MIQAVTLLSPNVGVVTVYSALISGHVFTHHPQKGHKLAEFARIFGFTMNHILDLSPIQDASSRLGGGFLNIFYFHPKIGEDSHPLWLAHIFFRWGWWWFNHQPADKGGFLSVGLLASSQDSALRSFRTNFETPSCIIYRSSEGCENDDGLTSTTSTVNELTVIRWQQRGGILFRKRLFGPGLWSMIVIFKGSCGSWWISLEFALGKCRSWGRVFRIITQKGVGLFLKKVWVVDVLPMANPNLGKHMEIWCVCRFSNAFDKQIYTHRIRVWYIYLHLVEFYMLFYGFDVGKYLHHTWILWDIDRSQGRIWEKTPLNGTMQSHHSRGS